MSDNTGGFPRSIRCLRSVEAYVGGRPVVAEKIGVTVEAVNRWVWARRIPRSAILPLVELSEQRFTAEDFLGGNDDKRPEDGIGETM